MHERKPHPMRLLLSSMDPPVRPISKIIQIVINHLQYSAIQLHCLCVENFVFWLVIYIKR